MQHPLVFFLLGIMFLAMAYLSFIGKLSVRWRSGYFFAPKDERNSLGFKTNSKLRSCAYFLLGVAAILFGFYLLYHKEWMQSTAMAIGWFTMISVIIASIVAVLVFGIKQRKRKKKCPTKNISLKYEEDINDEFSITEIRIDILRFPIIFGCYVLFPVIIFAIIMSFVIGEPLSELGDPNAQIMLFILTFILGPCCLILNKILPKTTFSYEKGIFTKKKGDKIETFHRLAINSVAMQSPVMPDFIIFYLKGREKPIKILMRGFKRDDRFEIPRKVILITKMKLNKIGQKMFDDFEKNRKRQKKD